MATIKQIRSLWNETTGSGYQEGRDYEDDGSGTPQVIPGSQLEADKLAGDTINGVWGVGSDAGPDADTYYRIDGSYSGVRKLAGLSSTWASGDDIAIDLEGLHINEHLRSHQSNIRFTGPADEASCQSLTNDSWIAVRLKLDTIDAAKSWSKEWRFRLTERKHRLDSRGIRHFDWFGADPSEAIRLMDVSEIPRGADAELLTMSGTTSDPPQTSRIGPQLYRLSDMLAALTPTGATLVMNAPDISIERLPDQGDGVELLVAALSATSYDLLWDGSRMVIQQFEPRKQLVSLILTDDHILEAKRELGRRRKALDAVRIERPIRYPMSELADSSPDPELPPANGSGSSELPSQSLTESMLSGDLTLYEVNMVWRPQQQYVPFEPGPLLFAFSDTRYLKIAYTSLQLMWVLRNSPGQVTMQPPTFFTPAKINGPNGLDFYFKVPISYVKIRESNRDYVDVWVVSRAGYYTVSGAVNRTLTPVANARVRLRDPNTGITLGPQTTNADGYARFNTGGNRARWFASVYHQTDSYLANKLDDFTSGHPYDDDPDNDELGPDNSVEQNELWQLPEEQGVQFSVKWKTGRPPEEGALSSLDGLYEAYRSQGHFSFGEDGPEVLGVDELSDLDLDPANITSEVQAGLWGEKQIEESEEELGVVVVTRMFSGKECERGRVVRLELGVDEGISENVRILTREITVRGPELLETFSSQVDKFVNEVEARFAMKQPVEVKLRQILKSNKKLSDAVLWLRGQRGDTSQMGNG